MDRHRLNRFEPKWKQLWGQSVRCEKKMHCFWPNPKSPLNQNRIHAFKGIIEIQQMPPQHKTKDNQALGANRVSPRKTGTFSSRMTLEQA